ncbi:MAG: arylsulfatase [Chthoniobacterales bacterium]|nr:arylsulfatase [Chthoniobacterales bacterium]
MNLVKVRPYRRGWMVFALLAVPAFFGVPSLEANAPQPNIVYFLVDDLGRADVGFNGSKKVQTPNIDRLAAEGAILDAYYVQPVCSPTRAALMTGRYPTHTGVYHVIQSEERWGLPLAERTLPQALGEAGYTTALCGKWHLGAFQREYRPTKRGFDHQYGHMFGMIDYFTHKHNQQLDWYRDDQPLAETGYTTHLIAREACRLIDQQPAGKPLFLYVAFNGVHSPYQVPDEYRKKYDNLTGVRRTQAGMISAVDEAIGQVIAALEEKGLKQNTLIIFSSDNGGPRPGKVAMNTPLRAGKGTIYEGGIRVCASATWPGKIPANTIIKEPMHAIDWYPTLLKLAGGSLAQRLPLDGLDIWPMLTKGAKTPHDAILLVGRTPAQAALRMGDWKLLRQASEQDEEETASAAPVKTNREAGEGPFELYNLAEDIGESKNLAAAEPEKVKDLQARLEAFLRDAVKPGDQIVGRPSAGSRKKRNLQSPNRDRRGPTRRRPAQR